MPVARPGAGVQQQPSHQLTTLLHGPSPPQLYHNISSVSIQPSYRTFATSLYHNTSLLPIATATSAIVSATDHRRTARPSPLHAQSTLIVLVITAVVFSQLPPNLSREIETKFLV